MTLQGEAPPARVRDRDRLSDAVRDVRLCQVPTCRAFARHRIEIELPAVWEGSATYTVLTVAVGACCEHASELQRRASAVLDARVDLCNLLAVVEGAVRVEAELRARLELAAARQERS